jgi:serine/threonine protein kinase
LHKNKIYHSDIKPANIAFSRDAELDAYIPKLIDFGGAGIGYNDFVSYTAFYFFNEKNRKKANLGRIKFYNAEERVKTDLYSLSIIAL